MSTFQKTMNLETAASSRPRDDRLDSWKQIAVYLKREVRTVQRCERFEGLPVQRLFHRKTSSVYAFASEVDAWLATRGRARVKPAGVKSALDFRRLRPERVFLSDLEGPRPLNATRPGRNTNVTKIGTHCSSDCISDVNALSRTKSPRTGSEEPVLASLLIVCRPINGRQPSVRIVKSLRHLSLFSSFELTVHFAHGSDGLALEASDSDELPN